MFCFFQSNQHFALSLPSKHLLVVKTSWSSPQDLSWRCLEDMPWRYFEDMPWRRLEDISWRRLVHVFSVTTFCLRKRLQDVFKATWNYIFEDVLEKEKSLRCRRYADILKTYLEDIFKTSLRQAKFLLRISASNHDLLTNLNQYLYLTNLYFMSLRWIQSSLIRTQ